MVSMIISTVIGVLSGSKLVTLVTALLFVTKSHDPSSIRSLKPLNPNT